MMGASVRLLAVIGQFEGSISEAKNAAGDQNDGLDRSFSAIKVAV